MAEVLLFHHALGLTEGCLALAEHIRAAGHRVHAPDLYDGRSFANLEDGVKHAQAVGFAAIIERGRQAAEVLPPALVYLGLSLGVLPAQLLAQTRRGAKGALLLHSAVPLEEFGGEWPDGVPLQIHTMADDAWGDVRVARALSRDVADCELFLYPGDRHLFADASTADYDAGAAALLLERVIAFLARVS